MRPFLVAAPLLLLAVSASAQIVPRRPGPSAPSTGPSVEAPECVSVRAESRQDGIGFTHVVVVRNACATVVRCQVATDADPEPTHALVVPAGHMREIVTHVGSPVPGVQPRAVCRQEGAGSAR